MPKIDTALDSASSPEAKPCCIVLIDDHAILREGLRELLKLEADFKVVGEASSVQEGQALTVRVAPDLVIIDVAIAGDYGMSIIQAVKSTLPDLRVLVLSSYEADEYVRAALEAGADGYVLKDAGREELFLAVRTVFGGRQYFSERISAQVVSGYLGKSKSEKFNGSAALTRREKEVLGLIALAHSTKQIAAELKLSAKTVEKHRSNLMRKLQLHNSAAVTLYAVKHKLISVDVT